MGRRAKELTTAAAEISVGGVSEKMDRRGKGKKD